MSTFIKGDERILYIWDSSIYRPVACLTSNSLSIARSVIETQTKCLPGVTESQSGALSYDISLEGNVIDTTSVGAEVTKASHDYLFDLIIAGTLVTWRISTGLTDDAYYYGTGYLTQVDDANPTADEFATFSGNIKGTGTIVKVDPEGT